MALTTVVASASCRPEAENQDRAAVVGRGGSKGIKAVVVCDGVGEFAGSGTVAERAVELAAAEIGRLRGPDGLAVVPEHVNRRLLEEGVESEGATTCLAVAAVDAGSVAYCFCGNGALLEVMGMPSATGRSRLLWVNHLLPHTAYARGRDALESFLPFAAGTPAISFGTIGVPPGAVRLFLACTDGMTSEEERREGAMADGSVWQEVSEPVSVLLDRLADCWEELSSPTADVDSLLQTVLTGTLDDLATKGSLDDDTTVGALLIDSLDRSPTRRNGRARLRSSRIPSRDSYSVFVGPGEQWGPSS